ncbi:MULTISPECIES: response regulator transcription factor [Spirulina sp. CCY15215]|jgi:DNA-binding NarL/FixJ family response regulator|uniref:response regulator transcription factor n=1 Tax=Spirulina sp. CCY15215 TaxID=2767591 RepID=UPI00194EDA9C|nr:response regulator transcription factor [Spirulina major]
MKETPQKENKKLLLVDDDPNLILLVKDYLEWKGYEVIAAENGQEALEILETNTPDMIICDVMMPEMDGYTFVEKVKENAKLNWIPFLFLSAKGQSSDRVKGLSKGADIYMVKPFEPEELVAQVKSSLSQVDRYRDISKKGIDMTMTLHVPEGVELTDREMNVVQLVAQGMKNKDIADQLNVSQRTVESHVSNMLHKTQLKNRTELARWAIESNQA